MFLNLEEVIRIKKIVIAILAFFLLPYAAKAENLITNPGFETGTLDGWCRVYTTVCHHPNTGPTTQEPPGCSPDWTSTSCNGFGRVEITTADPHSGSYAAKLWGCNCGVWLIQYFSPAVKRDSQLNTWIRRVGGGIHCGGGGIYVKGTDGGWYSIHSWSWHQSFGWTKITANMNAILPAGVNVAALRFNEGVCTGGCWCKYIPADYGLYVDDVELVELEAFDFSLSVNPSSGNVAQGESTTTTVTATLVSGTTKPVSFDCPAGLPSGASCSFSPTSCNPTCTSTLTISTSPTTPTGTHSITVRGTGGGITRSAPYTLTVLAPFDFSLSVNPSSATVTQGDSTTATVTATLLSGTTTSVSFSCNGLPSGVACSFNPTSCNPSCNSDLTISTSSATPTGTYTITIAGTGGGITKTTTYTLTVDVAVPPEIYTIYPGWNLISTAFKEITGITSDPCNLKIKKLYYLNRTTEKWEEKVWTQLESGKGYWIFSEARQVCEIEVSGSGSANIADIPQLFGGWNMIGAPATTVIFYDILGTCQVERGPLAWNSSKQIWVEATKIEPKKGYWIYVKKDCELG